MFKLKKSELEFGQPGSLNEWEYLQKPGVKDFPTFVHLQVHENQYLIHRGYVKEQDGEYRYVNAGRPSVRKFMSDGMPIMKDYHEMIAKFKQEGYTKDYYRYTQPAPNAKKDEEEEDLHAIAQNLGININQVTPNIPVQRPPGTHPHIMLQDPQKIDLTNKPIPEQATLIGKPRKRFNWNLPEEANATKEEAEEGFKMFKGIPNVVDNTEFTEVSPEPTEKPNNSPEPFL